MLAKFLLSVMIMSSMGCATAHSHGPVQSTSITETTDTILDNLKPMVLFTHLRVEDDNRMVSIVKPMLYVMVVNDDKRSPEKKDKH